MSEQPVSATDGVHVNVFVALSPAAAFRCFTEEVDLWWRRGPAFRHGDSMLRFEPGAGGRFVEHLANGREREIGRILVWQPGLELAFEWHGANFGAGEVTTVTVRFQSERDGTRVHVAHTGWDALPDAHPVRHGAARADFVGQHARWWAALADALADRARALSANPSRRS